MFSNDPLRSFTRKVMKFARKKRLHVRMIRIEAFFGEYAIDVSFSDSSYLTIRCDSSKLGNIVRMLGRIMGMNGAQRAQARTYICSLSPTEGGMKYYACYHVNTGIAQFTSISRPPNV